MTGPGENRLTETETLCPHGYVLPEAAHPAAGLEACLRCGFGFDFSRLFEEGQRLAEQLDASEARADALRADCMALARTAAQAEQAHTDVAKLRAEVRRYRASLTAHHEINTLSESAIAESLGETCQICARAQAGLAKPDGEEARGDS